MIARELLYISLNVSNLSAAEAFYTQALGFSRATPPCPAPAILAKMLGAQTMQTVKMQRGGQFIELASLDAPGVPYPINRHSNDLYFQHCALVTRDIMSDYRRLCEYEFAPISRHGPQWLPGGDIAFKFRDPDGHPLELIQFPKPKASTDGGIDHSAITVKNADESIAFYKDFLGLELKAFQRNTGPNQDALDDLPQTDVKVVALTPGSSFPHLELLEYVCPASPILPERKPSDLAASRCIFQVDALPHSLPCINLEDGTNVLLTKDPDGHFLLLITDSTVSLDK